jgi:hypothetical protein
VAFATRTLWHLPLGTTTRDRSWGWPGVAPALRTQLEGISNLRFGHSGASNRTGLKSPKCPHAATTEQKANEPLSTRGGHTACPLWVICRHNDPFASCPLCPLKQTFGSALSMSALCQKRTAGQFGDRRSSLVLEGRLKPRQAIAQEVPARQAGGEEWYGSLHVAAFSRSRAVWR